MNKAENNILVTIYILSDKAIINSIKNALKKKILVEIFIYLSDKSQNKKISKEFYKLGEQYKNLKIHEVNEKLLHAKVLVVDYKYVLIGSANLTFGGMVKNYELGVLIDDEEIARKVMHLVKKV